MYSTTHRFFKEKKKRKIQSQFKFINFRATLVLVRWFEIWQESWCMGVGLKIYFVNNYNRVSDSKPKCE